MRVEYVLKASALIEEVREVIESTYETVEHATYMGKIWLFAQHGKEATIHISKREVK
jgi:hypothetical protein